MPRLTKTSPAVRLLRSKFEDGEVTGTEDPKSVWQSENFFQDHKLHNFRTCYNNLRKEFAKSEDDADDEDGDTLARRCSFRDSKIGIKKRKSSEIATELLYDGESEDRGIGNEVVGRNNSFKPLYLLSVWTEPGTTTKRLSVAIVLPSGIDVGKFSIRVVDGGEYLELTITWPSPLLDIAVMHRKWIVPGIENGFERYHPKFIGFENALKELRSRSSDKIESVARIPLPFSVQAHITEKFNLAWRENSTRMGYIDLKAFVEEYAVVNDVQEFEIVQL